MSRPLIFPSGSRRRSKRGLHGEIVDQLGQLIVNDDAVADHPLVPDELLHQLDVSRTVLREALRTLESKGLITARPNVGTNVRPMNEWNLLDPDIIEWRALGSQKGDQLRELRGMRQVIETFAARLAAAIPDPDMESLATAVTDMDDAVGRGQEYMFAQADASFHQHLVHASGNLMLNHLFTTVAQGLNAYSEATCDCTDISVKNHWAVIDAIRQNSDEGERAIRDLLANPPDTDPVRKATLPQQRM